MTLGIAIPTYSGHLFNIKNLLDILQNSTVKPNKVSISCSSQSENITFEGEYDFEIIVNITEEYRNPSQNRNIAGSALDTDIISFIDGDDLPHFQRNEFIMRSFKDNRVTALLHNYHQSPFINNEFIYSKYENLNLVINYIDTVFPNGFTGSKTPNNSYGYHHAHLSIKQDLFNKFKYDENQNILYREDSIYVKELVLNGNNISYISNKLSQYIK
jgi:hypothetical protein